MNRYDISNDYRQKFIESNPQVWPASMHPIYFSINGDDIKPSTNSYAMEKAEHGLVIFTYTYTVISQSDCSMVPLFFSSTGEIEDYLIIDGWKIYFSTPITAFYRCNKTLIYMKKGDILIEEEIRPGKISEELPPIWALFAIIRKCSSQDEIDLTKKAYKQEKDLQENL